MTKTNGLFLLQWSNITYYIFYSHVLHFSISQALQLLHLIFGWFWRPSHILKGFFCKFTPSITIEQNRKTIKTHYVVAQIYPITPNITSKQTTQSRQIYNFFSQKFYHQHHPDTGILFLISNTVGWLLYRIFNSECAMRNSQFFRIWKGDWNWKKHEIGNARSLWDGGTTALFAYRGPVIGIN